MTRGPAAAALAARVKAQKAMKVQPPVPRIGHNGGPRLGDLPAKAPSAPFASLHPVAPAPATAPSHAQVAMDSAMAGPYEFANNFAYFGEGVIWPGFPYLAELTQRPEYRVISEVRAKEMTREGFKLTYSDEDDENAADKLKDLDQACYDFKIIDILRVAAEQDGFYGGGHIYIDVCDDNDRAEIAAPLKIDKAKIPKGGLKGFKNIEPIWCYPGTYNSTNPLAPYYFRPQQWYVNGLTVHTTRLLTLISREMPDILKAAYSFRGLSLSQMAKPYVDNWLRTRQSVSDLLHSFSIIAILSNLQAAIQGGPWEDIYNRVDQFNVLRDNRGAFVLDKETEDIKSIAVPLGTLDKLQAQSQEQMASVCQTPLVKLLGVTPSGLNASSDGEIRVFYDTIHALQEHLFTPALRTMLNCLQLHLWGEIDPHIGFEFVKLWQLDEAALAAVKKTKADTAAVYIQEGVLSPEEVRKDLAADKDGDYAGIDPDDLPDPPDPGDGFDDVTTPGGGAKPEPAAQQRSGV